MKKNPRFLTACASCRRLKRKCDYMKLGHGPCSNCIARKIAHLCNLNESNENEDGNEGDMKTSESTLFDTNTTSTSNVNSSVVHHIDESVHTTVSYSRKRRITSTHPTYLDVDDHSSIYSKITTKLLLSCVTKFFQNSEWSYFLDQDVIMNAVIERQTAIDKGPLSLVYILAACIVLRRGAQVSESSDFKGSRKLLSGELYAAHLKCSEGQISKNIITLQAMILRSHYHLHMEQNEPAWEALYQAIGIYNALAIPPRANSTNIRNLKPQQMVYDRTWTALCCLETIICSFSNRKSTLLLLSHQSSTEYPSLFNYDFKLERRYKTLWFTRETQLFIESIDHLQDKYTIFRTLDSQIIAFINLINDQEGKLLPYGQTYLYGCLVKLCTQNILNLKQQESKIIDLDNSVAITKLSVIDKAIEYSKEFANCLESLANNAEPPALGSSPFLAMYVFQALTCIWILASMEKKSQIGNDFSLLKTKLVNTLETIREDRGICKRTTILFNGLDILSHLKLDEQDPYNVIIPIQLQGGILTVSKAWDEERDRIQRENEVWTNFRPFLDDNKFWSTLTAQAEFDYTMQPLELDDWFKLM